MICLLVYSDLDRMSRKKTGLIHLDCSLIKNTYTFVMTFANVNNSQFLLKVIQARNSPRQLWCNNNGIIELDHSQLHPCIGRGAGGMAWLVPFLPPFCSHPCSIGHSRVKHTHTKCTRERIELTSKCCHYLRRRSCQIPPRSRSMTLPQFEEYLDEENLFQHPKTALKSHN
jgi:hypothetical protein